MVSYVWETTFTWNSVLKVDGYLFVWIEACCVLIALFLTWYRVKSREDEEFVVRKRKIELISRLDGHEDIEVVRFASVIANQPNSVILKTYKKRKFEVKREPIRRRGEGGRKMRAARVRAGFNASRKKRGGRGAPVVNESAPLKVEVQTVMLKERFRQAKKRRESRRWGSWHRFIGNGNKRDHF